MIEHYLKLILLTALVIWGIHCVLSPRFVFHFIGEWIKRTVGEYWSKPIYSCPACMSSLYGVAACVIARVNFLHAPFFILALCGLNFILIEFLYPSNEDTEEDDKKQDQESGK
jgi:quinol-cytochrome oxidoreductase complex cytochrome b subunit